MGELKKICVTAVKVDGINSASHRTFLVDFNMQIVMQLF
jgi:hypothetical protein